MFILEGWKVYLSWLIKIFDRFLNLISIEKKMKEKINSYSVPTVADREQQHDKDNKLVLG